MAHITLSSTASFPSTKGFVGESFLKNNTSCQSHILPYFPGHLCFERSSSPSLAEAHELSKCADHAERDGGEPGC